MSPPNGDKVKEEKKEPNYKEELDKLKKEHNRFCETVADIGLQMQILGRNNKR